MNLESEQAEYADMGYVDLIWLFALFQSKIGPATVGELWLWEE